MRVAVIDIGTNTTRLLIAERRGEGTGNLVAERRADGTGDLVAERGKDGDLVELERRTTITTLGEGVDTTARLADAAMRRVEDAIAEYRRLIDEHGADRVVAVATSAMRDAGNGPAFREHLNARYGVDAQTISGDEEAKLTFLGATAGRDDDRETVVIDIGGGSTEYVAGRAGGEPSFRTSVQMGSVRHTERFLKSDPPTRRELGELVDEVVKAVPRVSAEQAIAVAGTATSLAAIDGADPVHGQVLGLEDCERIAAMLASMTLQDRREVNGLHPDRAPTIVAGATILTESVRTLGLDRVEVSEHDILHGAAAAADEIAP
jgi:exopolyphosphatase / guanosine-5'-triphosphate,3'-diphosphate pyrophosphatase